MLPINPNLIPDVIHNIEQQPLQMQDHYFEIMAFNALNFDELDEDEKQLFLEELHEIAADQNLIDELLEWGVNIHDFLEEPEPIDNMAPPIQVLEEADFVVNNHVEFIEDEEANN